MTYLSASPDRYLPSLLVVEDSNEDFEALKRCLQRSPIKLSMRRCENGDQALALLHQDSSREYDQPYRPGLVILDLNLPGTDGREVLRRMKQDTRLKMIPVVVFTTSNNPKDIADCYQYGANSYIVKPINFVQLKHDVQTLVSYWFEVVTLPD